MTRFPSITWPIIFFAFVAFSDRALPQDLPTRIDKVVVDCMDQYHLPGMAVVVVQKGETIFKNGYGFANVRRGKLVDPDQTLFRIGSISKALTFLALTSLIDEGQIQRNDDVAGHFDGIQNPNQYQQPVTIEHLLTHTSGFDQFGRSDRQVHDYQLTLTERKANRPTIQDYLRNGNLRRVTPAGDYFRYDTYGSTLAGVVIESITELPFAEAMREVMFAPLGMSRTSVEVSPQHQDDLALGYGFVGGDYVSQAYEVFATTPASSIDSTAADMGRLLEALTSDGANEHGRLFSAETAKEVLAPQFRSHPEFVGATHGLLESHSHGSFEKSVRIVGHGGSMRGYIASLTIVPQFDLGVFIATNRAPEAGGGGMELGGIIETVIDELCEVPVRRRYDVPEYRDDIELAEYLGDYYYGVYCHSCTPEDQARGCWNRGSPRTVTSAGRALVISGQEFRPRGDDVFVREDGEQMVFFGRHENGKISFFVFSSSADTFEKESSH